MAFFLFGLKEGRRFDPRLLAEKVVVAFSFGHKEDGGFDPRLLA